MLAMDVFLISLVNSSLNYTQVQVVHKMFFHALLLDRARVYSMPLAEVYVRKNVIPCPRVLIHQKFQFPLISSNFYLRIDSLSWPNIVHTRAARC